MVPLAALVLAGCGGGPEPRTLPSPSSSASAPASASASAGPVAPVLPAAAKEKTKAGAIAVARTFILTVNYSGSTGDTKPLRALYIPFCTRCEALADGIDRTYKGGGYFRGGGWTPTRFKFYAIKNDVAFLDATVNYAAQVWLEKSGGKAKSFPASQDNLKAFNLRWTRGQWRVSALDPSA